MEELQRERTLRAMKAFFVDSSKVSLKAMLLRNWNTFPSVPVVHAIHMKETYENLQVLLKEKKS
jgi:hypothetical protein